MSSDPDGERQVSRPATKDDFVMHNVKSSDTLERICIQYDVNKDGKFDSILTFSNFSNQNG